MFRVKFIPFVSQIIVHRLLPGSIHFSLVLTILVSFILPSSNSLTVLIFQFISRRCRNNNSSYLNPFESLCVFFLLSLFNQSMMNILFITLQSNHNYGIPSVFLYAYSHPLYSTQLFHIFFVLYNSGRFVCIFWMFEPCTCA